MFAFPSAKRPLGLAASLLLCLLVTTAAGPAAAAEDQGYLGIMLQDLTPSMAKALQLDDRPGVLINQVVEGGPAQKAGLLDGDVILQLNGQAVSDYAAFTGSVRALAPGTKASLLVLRDGKQKTFEVEMGKREALPEPSPGHYTEQMEKLKKLHKLEGLENLKELENLQWFDSEDGRVLVLPHGGGGDDGEEGDGPHRFIIRKMADDRGWLGVHLDDLNSQLGDYFGVKDGAGALVTEVVQDSPAAAAGLRAGDVIVKAGDAEVDSPDALHDAMTDTKPGDTLAFQVVRKGSRKTLDVKLGEMPEDAMAERRIEIFSDGEPGDMKVFAPQMPRHPGAGPGGDDGDQRRIVIERRRQAGGEMDGLRAEMDALRQELQQLREELKR